MRSDIREFAGAIPRRGDDRALANQHGSDRNLAAPAGRLCFLQRATQKPALSPLPRFTSPL